MHVGAESVTVCCLQCTDGQCGRTRAAQRHRDPKPFKLRAGGHPVQQQCGGRKVRVMVALAAPARALDSGRTIPFLPNLKPGEPPLWLYWLNWLTLFWLERITLLLDFVLLPCRLSASDSLPLPSPVSAQAEGEQGWGALIAPGLPALHVYSLLSERLSTPALLHLICDFSFSPLQSAMPTRCHCQPCPAAPAAAPAASTSGPGCLSTRISRSCTQLARGPTRG